MATDLISSADETGVGEINKYDFITPSHAVFKAEKGLNFPDTDLGLCPLTAKDLKDLDFVCRHADMVGYSFVETVEAMHPFYVIRALGGSLFLLGALLMAWNLWKTVNSAQVVAPAGLALAPAE